MSEEKAVATLIELAKIPTMVIGAISTTVFPSIVVDEGEEPMTVVVMTLSGETRFPDGREDEFTLNLSLDPAMVARLTNSTTHLHSVMLEHGLTEQSLILDPNYQVSHVVIGDDNA